MGSCMPPTVAVLVSINASTHKYPQITLSDYSTSSSIAATLWPTVDCANPSGRSGSLEAAAGALTCSARYAPVIKGKIMLPGIFLSDALARLHTHTSDT